MLFNSFEFILVFLTGLLLVYAIVGHANVPAWMRKAVLILASAIFIAHGGFLSLLLLFTSLATNYLFLRYLQAETHDGRRRGCVIVSVIFNLSFIGVFKYADFFVGSAATVLDQEFTSLGIALPLAISFYTFQLIALTVDSWRHKWCCPPILDYVLFIIFFPQLIAGPVVRLQEVKGQIENLTGLMPANIAAGVSVFCVGLFKKAFVADSLAEHSDIFFAMVESGADPTFFEAWGGVLLYTFQIYFDFSGYSDMAIGLAWIFGISLPVNFMSPYKARSIIEFWRHWHMTLSRFLRDYLYIPLGGNRHGPFVRWAGVFVTMLLGGLWHGASWNFVIWGGMHGISLAVNHAFRALPIRLPSFLCWCLTFGSVVFAWVLFRTTEFDDAIRIYAGMLGMNGFVLPLQFAGALEFLRAAIPGLQFAPSELIKLPALFKIAIAVAIVFFLPNTEETFRPQGKWKPVIPVLWAARYAALGFIGFVSIYNAQEFIYFRF
ncbi:MAG: membrane-bound O-acyltransferase family protein [Alphaproteobacteria bacterium]|nr:membrane-bound O-acyltransferase family protein [Alphaproteobacteria bacterium]